MFYLIAVLLTITLFIFVKNELHKKIKMTIVSLNKLSQEYSKLSQENAELKEYSSGLASSLEKQITLYDVTKDICKSLDEDKIFSLFKERLTKYINTQDCKFIKDEAELAKYSNYSVFPLIVSKKTIGYLAATDVKREEEEILRILGQQFLLGIQRSLLYRKVQELTITDSLTQVYSRRYFLEKFDEEISRSKRFKLRFSFLMVDIDHFKEINDRYGHLVGDAIIKEVTKTIKENIRQVDFIGRYGGEELSIVLTETDKNQASFVAERIRQAIESKVISVYDENLKVTISIGISLFPINALDNLKLIDKADKALYQAKNTGRNRVVLSA